jgi:endonuclease YncB( thermonuclease family)
MVAANAGGTTGTGNENTRHEKTSAAMNPIPLVVLVLLSGGLGFARAEELQRLDGVVLLPHAANDGDSFHARAGADELTLRLYFVDCCETAAGSESDARRVREQMRYFGLPDAQRTLHFGAAAKAFTAKALSQPFTVHTAYARALGRSAFPRVYAMVTTADGADLATLLVQNGLARAFGVGRALPNGVSRDEQVERLRDLEAVAMLKRTGVWADTNPDRLAELRAEERQEEHDLDAFMDGSGTAPAGPAVPLDINRASREQLAAVPGLRPEWVDAILARRPYARLDDLLKIKGIGPKTLEKLRERLAVGNTP